ncbi:PAS domain S-box protein [Phenylobacterium sp.]|uniref:PAS domain S-box protein n=1 Tax=Phenylobacterium sp. TaxID=1871053 RepID=UPI0025F3C5B0|nr:PAS domain S-box protein [Phenylobacterium sp.]
MTIARRFTLAAVAAALFTAIVLAIVVDFSIRSTLYQSELQAQEASTARIASDLSGEVRGVRQDVEAVALAAPVEAVLAASQAGRPPPPAALAETLRVFQAEMAAKPSYVQLRLIGRARGGREVVRVDRNEPDAPPNVVPEAGLQSKGDRPYVTETLNRAPGEVYVSSIELNREHGKVQVPHMPVLRAGVPVFAASDRPVGMVIINVDMRESLKRLQRLSGAAAVYVVDPQGRYLVHPDPARAFAHEFGAAKGLAEDFPGLADVLTTGAQTAREIETPGGMRTVAAAAPALLGGATRVFVITMTPSGGAAAARNARWAILVAAVAAVLIGAALAIFLARGVSRPIVEITEAARHFADSGDLRLPSRRTGEAGVLADTLERMHATIRERNAALERDEKRLRQVIDGAPTAMLMVDRQGLIQLSNARADDLFGYAHGELLGRKIETLTPESARSQHPRHLEGFFARPEARAMGGGRELFGLRKDGQEVPVEIGLSPIETPEGSFTLAAVIDVSERRAAEMLQSRLVAIVESSQDAIVGKTLDGVVTSWNSAAEALFGFAAKQMIGRTMSAVIPKRLANEEQDLLRRVAQGEKVQSFETVRRLRNGREIDVSVTLSPLVDSHGRVIGASSISRDITEAKRRQDELRRSNASLEQFAYVASHDLQEPLRMVANFTDLLAKRYKGQLDEKADKYLAFASEGAHRMQRLVADLLAYSRVGSQGKPLVPTSSGAVIDAVVRSLGAKVRETEAVVEHKGLPEVLADEVQLGQLFQNLIGNALKFRGEAPPRITITATRAGGFWEFRVADNGIGIDPRFAERIFQMFQRLHERGIYEGSGIGLAISKQIVERHGGAIRVESEPGSGATFIFTLRAVPEVDA